MYFNRSAKVLLVAVAIGSLGFFAMNVEAQDVGSGGVGGRPAYPREDNSRSNSIFIHTLDPGESVKDGVNVINNSNEEKSVLVYPTDSVVSSGGAFACEQFVDERDGVGSWITLDKNRVTLASAENEIIDFIITVPANADVGEHNGCVVMQGEEQNESTEGIGLSFRSAIRVAILVPGDIVKQLEIVGFTPKVGDEKVTLTTNVENKGNVSVDADVQTVIDTFWGRQISQTGGQFPVLRGEVSEWNFDHDKPFWGGWYKTSVSVEYDSNPDNFIGEEAQPTTEHLEYPAQWIFVQPSALALAIELVTLLLLAVAIIMILRWLAAKRRVKKTWVNHKVLGGENIKSIAKSRNISWKKLAKANHLKAPYTLEPGKTIKVPPKKS